MQPDPRALPRLSDLALTYKGDGDYDVTVGPVVLEFSYDGSDVAVGTWTFWNVRIGEQRFGGTQLVGPGPFAEWLEENARGEHGHLSDEPQEADSATP